MMNRFFPAALKTRAADVSASMTRVLRILQFAVTGTLIAWLATRLNWHVMISLFATIHPSSILISVGLVGVSHLLCSVCSLLCLSGSGSRISLLRVMENHLRGLFANQFLPSTIAGDFFRLGDLCHRNPSVPWLTATAVLLLQRICGLFIAAALVMLLGTTELIPQSLIRIAAVGLMAVTLGIGLIGLLFRRQWADWLNAEWWQPASLPRWSVVAAVGFSLAQQITLIMATWVMARGLGLPGTVFNIAVVVPLSLLAVILPISVNGLGVREAVYAHVLSHAGVSTEAAVGLALSMLMISTVYALLGGATYWRPISGSLSPSAVVAEDSCLAVPSSGRN